MIVGTAGHIDHGKTALVRALTGVDTDRLPEEKRRGITIDLGFAPLELEGLGVAGVVDVPGHEAFVRTMVAGATGVDVALLVIAADEGVMPQTREHLAILSLLGVRSGVIALTKRDLVDEDWLALVAEDARAAASGTPLAAAPVVPVSSVTGAGLDALRAALTAALRAGAPRDDDDLFRMPIDRVFTVRGTGTVVTGTVWSGSLSRGRARLSPSGVIVRVRELQYHGRTVDRVTPGTRAAVALADVDPRSATRGTALLSEQGWAESRVVRATVTYLAGAKAPGPRSRVQFHLGSAECTARVVGLGDPQARIHLSEAMACRAGDRFVLRAGSPPTTIGGGRITDPLPPTQRPRALSGDLSSPAGAVAAMAEEAGPGGISIQSLPQRVGIAPRSVQGILERAGLIASGATAFAARAIEKVEAQLVQHVSGFHVDNPLAPGAPLESARGVVRAGPDLFQLVLGRLTAAGRVTVDGAAIRIAGFVPKLSDTADRRAGELVDRLAEPMDAADAEREAGADLLHYLEARGEVVRLGGLVASITWTRSSLDALRNSMQHGKEYAPAELRELLGLSRRTLIPLLEYADRAGVTERRGGARILRSP